MISFVLLELGNYVAESKHFAALSLLVTPGNVVRGNQTVMQKKSIR